MLFPFNQMKPHVMGSGDLGLFANSCQCNEYASADSMFVFGGVAYNGFLTSYTETCASLIGVTYSTSDGREFYNNIVNIYLIFTICMKEKRLKYLSSLTVFRRQENTTKFYFSISCLNLSFLLCQKKFFWHFQVR